MSYKVALYEYLVHFMLSNIRKHLNMVYAPCIVLVALSGSMHIFDSFDTYMCVILY